MQHSDLCNGEHVRAELVAINQRLSRLERILLLNEKEQEMQLMQHPSDLFSVINKIHQFLDQGTILNAVVTGVRQLLQTDRVIVIHFTPETACSQGTCLAADALPGVATLLHQTVRSQNANQHLFPEILPGQVLVLDPDYLFDAWILDGTQDTVQSSLVAPLVLSKQLWGVLLVHHCATARTWQPQEIELLPLIATHTETAIGHAQQLAEVERRSAVLQTSLVNELRKRADDLTLKAEQEATFNMDGYEATRQIKAGQCHCASKILALTANAFEEERLVALAIGCDDFVRKPYQEEMILEKMAEHLGVRYLYKEPDEFSTPDNPMPSSLPPASGPPHLPGSASQPLKVLVAEDNPLNQKLMVQILKRLGYQAEVANNGLEVLNRLRQQFYDIVLMDVQMPEMDGITTTQRIYQEWTPAQRPAIIAVSGRTLPEEQRQCMAAGMTAYLPKPFKLEALATVLQQCQPLLHSTPPCCDPQNGLQPAVLDQEALQDIQESANGDFAFVVSLIDTYMEEAPKLLATIRKALDHQQIDRLGWAAHSFKTMSAHLGAMEFSRLCQELEDMSVAGQVTVAPEFLNQLETEYKRVELALVLEQRQARARLTAALTTGEALGKEKSVGENRQGW